MTYRRVIAPLASAVILAAAGGTYVALAPAGIPENYLAEVVSASLFWGSNGIAIGLLANFAIDRRLRFTIRNILFSTFWVAVCLAAWPGQTNSFGFYLTINAVKYVSMYGAIGALLGCPWRGLIIGVALYAFWIVSAALIIASGLPGQL